MDTSLNEMVNGLNTIGLEPNICLYESNCMHAHKDCFVLLQHVAMLEVPRGVVKILEMPGQSWRVGNSIAHSSAGPQPYGRVGGEQ